MRHLGNRTMGSFSSNARRLALVSALTTTVGLGACSEDTPPAGSDHGQDAASSSGNGSTNASSGSGAPNDASSNGSGTSNGSVGSGGAAANGGSAGSGDSANGTSSIGSSGGTGGTGGGSGDSGSAGDGGTAAGGSGGDGGASGSTGSVGSSGGNTGTGTLPGAQSDLHNREAVIPPMCYTRTEGYFNPCYTCHQKSVRGEGRANLMNDGVLQGDYGFSDVGQTNHWDNLFEDRSTRVAAITDETIDAWVDGDNYSALPQKLEDAGFQGWIPDLENLEQGAEAFDDKGLAKNGSWWVAFKYKPLPSTFWPTNGATDDVMIRLPAKFWRDESDNDSVDVYYANLAIVEAAVKDIDSISVPPIDESKIGNDLNGDSALTTITRLDRPDHYVGQAASVPVVTYLYPEGTEFLHTVRYLNVTDDDRITISTRMKEVRYLRKWRFVDKVLLGAFYDEERQEKIEGNLPYYADRQDKGIRNSFGWDVAGFIEDKDGSLRPLEYEENLFCMGCHSTIGSTIDETFAFPRKVTGAAGWGYISLEGMADVPNLGETDGEILTYLRRVGGGSEFRTNPEMRDRFFNMDGTVNETAVAAAADVYELIAPSPERARALNKAYRVIVEDQDFILGRDPTSTPPVNVFPAVDPETAPTLPVDRQFQWDIRLSWPDP